MAFRYGPHTFPQVPQLAESIWVLVHVPEHVVSGALQAVPHVPATHIAPPVQGFPHLPQLLLSVVVSVHVPLQKVCVPGHVHALVTQVCPPTHAVPQVPQLLLSLVVSVQLPLHDVCPVGHPASLASVPASTAASTAASGIPLSIPEASCPPELELELSPPLLLLLSWTVESRPVSAGLSAALSTVPSIPPPSGWLPLLESPRMLASTPAHWVEQLLMAQVVMAWL
jgi:hypothetical protein